MAPSSHSRQGCPHCAPPQLLKRAARQPWAWCHPLAALMLSIRSARRPRPQWKPRSSRHDLSVPNNLIHDPQHHSIDLTPDGTAGFMAEAHLAHLTHLGSLPIRGARQPCTSARDADCHCISGQIPAPGHWPCRAFTSRQPLITHSSAPRPEQRSPASAASSRSLGHSPVRSSVTRSFAQPQQTTLPSPPVPSP